MRTFLVLALALAGCASPIATLTESELVGTWQSPPSTLNCNTLEFTDFATGQCFPSRLTLRSGGVFEVRSERISRDCRSGEQLWVGRWALEPAVRAGSTERALTLTLDCVSEPVARACEPGAAAAALCRTWQSLARGGLQASTTDRGPVVQFNPEQRWTRAPQ
jgi:hypothetical protein